MRKITAGLFISLDGVVENPHEWHLPYFNDEMGAAVTATLGAADTVLLGRKTYDTFAAAWPERETAGGDDATMARALGDARKIVVSNQELKFTWRNSEQLAGDLVEAVTALKAEPGDSNIGMSGSVSVVRQLLASGLVDELHLLVHPIAVGSGMRLFDEGEGPIPLTLISSAAFETGVLNLVYRPAEPTGEATYDEAKAHLREPETGVTVSGEVVTAVDATVDAAREQDLLDGYRLMNQAPKPDGFVRSELLRGQGGAWRIQTTWRNRDALMALRRSGKPPAALELLDRLGAEHSHGVFAVEESYHA